jgi:hypothetical protein
MKFIGVGRNTTLKAKMGSKKKGLIYGDFMPKKTLPAAFLAKKRTTQSYT